MFRSLIFLTLAFCLAFLVLTPSELNAHPQYAVRYNINSCTACHVSPTGGGPRNLNGKLFGAGGFEMNRLLEQDYVSADLRALYYYPQEASTSKGGMGVMSGSVAGHVFLDSARRIRLVLEQNFAGFALAPYRDTYGLIKLSSGDTPNVFDTLLVGRFRVPFGIVTDEHRTYVRFQNQTRWFDFETGAMLSGNPNYQWHYDVALVSGEKSMGTSLGSGQALRWGTILNLRYIPGAIAVGASASFHDHAKSDESRKSASLYAVLSVARWTQDRVPLTVQVEHLLAWQWNSVLMQGFISDPAYATAVSRSTSQGWLASLEWEFSRRFSLLYKYDLLIPDRDYRSDFYARHGLGGKWKLGANATVLGRVEFATASPPSESKGDAIGRQNAAFGILQLGF